MGTTKSSEGYLEAILVIRRLRGSCRNVDIAERLGRSKPSVSKALSNLAAAGLGGLLDEARSVPSDDVSRGKPDPEGYRLAAERFGVDPARAVAFEDSRVGAQAALAAGVGRVYVCPPPSAPPQDYPAAAIRLPAWSAAFPDA